MITIRTNTRGSTQMPARKDYAEMSGPELVAAYNKLSDTPVKKFKDKATALARLAALETAKAAGKVAKKANGKANGHAVETVAKSDNKRAAEFGARVGSFREKLIMAFDANFRKQVPVPDLLKAVYGSKNTENTGALMMVIKGASGTIEKKKLPYEIVKEKNEEKEISFGLKTG